MDLIAQNLMEWFDKHKRDLPWRHNRDWYKIFLSEFLLQQTQVSQALPYYQKFIQKYPTVHHLAKAEEDELLQLWAGLGYYSRARNLLKAARQIVEEFNGNFPLDLKNALKLPGIGPYTAAAILSLAFNQPVAVVDGNVLRVISRLFAIEDDIRLPATQSKIRETVQQLLPASQAGLFNEALMELGALVCKPVSPQCTECPLNQFCLAHQKNLTSVLPFKSAAKPKKERFQFVFVVRNKRGQLLLAQRPGRGLLARMWEFPALEVDSLEKIKLENLNGLLNVHFNAVRKKQIKQLPILKHTYSHIALQFLPILIHNEQPIFPANHTYMKMDWVDFKNLDELAIHNAHKKILKHKDFQVWWGE